MRRSVQHDLDLFGFDARLQLRHFKIDNAHQVRFLERMEDDDLVEAIEKLGFKDTLGFIENFIAHRSVIMSFSRCTKPHHRLFLEQISADIRCHDNDRISEIDLAA